MWKLKKKWSEWTYLWNRNRVIGVENRHGYWGKWGHKDALGDWDWHIHTATYKITNNYLLYSVGNFNQNSVMACMRKEFKKEWIYVYV